ncbi:unnamed protein product, partial [marine sediment metagenome]
MKKWIFIIFVLGLIFGVFDFVFAQEEQVEINFFYSKTCPHCTEEKVFLAGLEEKYPEIKINKFILSDRESVELLIDFYDKYEV